ncbi:hypothetical protein KQH50_00955 [bacterium]|nr:hypothetical protein [bacterium]
MKHAPATFILILVSFFLFSCSAETTPESALPTPTTSASATPTATETTAPTATSTPEPLPTSIPNDFGLTIEENEIEGKFDLDRMDFTPVHGSKEAILARHADEKEEPHRYLTAITLEDGQILRADIESMPEEKIKAILELDGEHIFEVDAGDVSPLGAHHGLWLDGDAWVLEIGYVTMTLEDDSDYLQSRGIVYRDGVNLNDLYGFDEIFGYQILAGKPFFFYKLDGKIHLSYDGQDLPVWYDNVWHHYCCSAGALNPTQAPNWVGFWGERDGIQYYTEIGKY